MGSGTPRAHTGPYGGDGYQLTVSGVIPTTCDFFKLPAKQPKPRKIRPGRNFKLTLTLPSTLKETLPEMDVMVTLPAGVTHLNTKSRFAHKRATVTGNMVAVKLHQVRGTAKKYCLLEGTSQVSERALFGLVGVCVNPASTD